MSESVSTSIPVSGQSLKPTPAQVVARMLLRRDVVAVKQEHDHDIMVRGEMLLSIQDHDDTVSLVGSLRSAFEPLLIEAFEAGRLSVLGDLRERVQEIPSFDGAEMMPATECPVCPGPTEHEGEICDDCAAYVGMVG